MVILIRVICALCGAVWTTAVAYIALWPFTPRNELTPDALPYFWYVLSGAPIVGGILGAMLSRAFFKKP